MFRRNVLPPYSWCTIIDLKFSHPVDGGSSFFRNIVRDNILRGVTGLTQKAMIRVIIIIIIIISVIIIVVIVPQNLCISRLSRQKK
jgi:hypothetical protein